MPLNQSFDYTATPPGTASPEGLAWAPVRAVALTGVSLANPPLTVGGVLLAYLDRVLLAGQNPSWTRGLYVLSRTGAEKAPAGTPFDSVALTPTTVGGLVAGQSYIWVRGANTTSLQNGADELVASCVFIAAGTSVDLYGTPDEDILDSLKAAVLARAADAAADADFVSGKLVEVREGTDAGLHALGIVGALPITNSLPLTFERAATLSSASSGVGSPTVTAPTTPAHGVGAMTATAPGEYLLPGAPAPVNTATPVAPPTVVAHGYTLQAGVNYLVQVGSRSAPVNVTLPPIPTAGQRIEVVDTSGQGALHPITVDAGAVDIEAAGIKTYLINRNDAVLALYYTGAKWKLL